uniref:Reverse transcriptase domain-containing protein n=1 Tax=Tanacetum cinerariifolium TaxID=118510 RepID=A0A6L2LMP5_TANCI|nr:hypothetical protein [Tanacetum cinerariifolium]
MGRNLEAYMDDMVIKSKIELEMIKDIKETLLTLKKSEFRKSKGCKNVSLPSNLKQMQRLSGKLAALNRLLFKAAKRALPCLDTLKKCTKKKDLHWTTEVKEAFQTMKKLIAELPTLTAPKKEFRVPTTIITDNGTQLINDPFKSWAKGIGIKLVSTSEEGVWVKELPNVLWAHKTTPKTSNEETPFSLAYGTEAIIPVEIGIPTRKTIQGSDKENEEALRLHWNEVSPSLSLLELVIKQLAIKLVEEYGFVICLSLVGLTSRSYEDRPVIRMSQSRQHDKSKSVSLGCSRNTTRIMRRTIMVTFVFTLCEEQVIWNSVLMRLIDELLALDSIVCFAFSDRRLERTATFSISTNSA